MLGSLNERQDRLERDIEVVKGDVRLIKHEVNVIVQEQSILEGKCKKIDKLEDKLETITMEQVTKVQLEKEISETDAKMDTPGRK